jgi:Toprim-like
VVCEGEFDAMLLYQDAGDLCGVITLGSASDPLDVPTWASYLLPVTRLLVAYDVDSAGEKGASRLLEITKRAERLPVPKLGETDKDITDFY